MCLFSIFQWSLYFCHGGPTHPPGFVVSLTLDFDQRDQLPVLPGRRGIVV